MVKAISQYVKREVTRAAVVWSEGHRLRWAELQEGASAKLGRDPNANIVIGDVTVSGEHARFTHHDGIYYIENLSRTNLTRLNNVIVESPTPLTDGDSLDVGLVKLVFHDLRSAGRISGLVCSHCSRESLASDSDCWYCGTSLVNAPTFIARRLPLICRIISEAGPCHNLYPGEVFSVNASGEGALLKSEEVPEDAAAAVTVKDGSPLLVSVSEPPITVNGGAISSPQELRNGDELRVGEGHFLVIMQ